MKIVNPYKFISRILILILLLAALYIYFPREEAILHLPEPMTTAKVTVLSGDTLWSFAENLFPENPRQGVYTLKQMNNLENDLIYPGQTLMVPSDSAHQTAQE